MTGLRDLGARIEARQARIGVMGLGYVGLPLVVEFAKAGFAVTGFELDAEKVRSILSSRSYIEDVPESDLAAQRANGRLHATVDMDELALCDVINVCVPTPLTKTKDPDFSFMVAAVEEIRKRLRPGQLIILGSTTYPGTTHELYLPLLEATGMRVGEGFSLAFAPERIDPANKKFKVRNVPKVVGGETPLCTQLAVKSFEPVFDTVIPMTSSQAAEMVKLLENTFRAINIGLANEVALMCDKLSLDVWEVIEAAATKPYGYMKFLPGPGLGGHCIPIDPTYLSWKMKALNFPARFIELATEINTQMPVHVVRKMADILNEDRLAVNGSRILVLGVAYKANVSDMRESPAIEITELLLQKGAQVEYHDPHVPEFHVGHHVMKSVDLDDAALGAADLVVILTDHGGMEWDRIVARSQRVFDTRNATQNVRTNREKVRKL